MYLSRNYCFIFRSRLEGLCTSFLQNCTGSLQTVLDKARMKRDDIHKVCSLAGYILNINKEY